MSMLNGQWIELFRAGDYGDKGSYSAADIDNMIRNFNPAEHEPPVVMGHPEHDAPAYGWVSALKRNGNVLLGMLKQVPQQFEDLVRGARFKKRSISFYRTDRGPVLRHVGFLGAMPPEVKGLADVKLASFSAGAFEAIEFKEEASVDGNEIKKAFSESMDSLKTFFSELFKGKKIVDLNEGDQGKAMEAAVEKALKPLQDSYTNLEKQFSDYKKEAEKRATTITAQEQTQFAEAQIARVKAQTGRWVPAFDKMGVPAIFAALATSAVTVEFGEGDKKTKKPLAEVFADFLIGLGELVPGGVLVQPQQRTGTNLVQFNEPSSRYLVVDTDSVALAEAATQLSLKEKITYGEALNRVRASGEYAGAAAAGQV
jgi:hypothetical protein